MPELRRDPMTGRWVIISPVRGKRPVPVEGERRRSEPESCPFCPGNEDQTQPEVLSFGRTDSGPNQPGWSLRVVSNTYPALKIEGSLDQGSRGMYDRMDGVGAHEVFIETPHHAVDLVDLPLPQIRDVLWAYRERMIDLERDKRFQHLVIFKNHGEEAGATQEHSHSQLIATPIVPMRLEEELRGAERYFESKNKCVLCDMVSQELKDGERLVSDHGAFVAFEPFASRFPFETCIAPKTHQAGFLQTQPEDLDALAACLKDTLLRLKLALDNPPLNYIMHSCPVNGEHHDYFHWHLEIIPRLTRKAGFEWGTGFYINPTVPEEAADILAAVDTGPLMNEPSNETSQ